MGTISKPILLDETGQEIVEQLESIAGSLSNRDAVKFTVQTLTDSQKAQARANIGAAEATVNASVMPAGGFVAGVEYDLGEVTGTVAFLVADGLSGKRYFWTFNTGATAPTVTWPSGIEWPSDFTPNIAASKHYEVNVRNGYALLSEFDVISA